MAPYDFKAVEKVTREFWKAQNIYAKVKTKHENGKDFYFLDGPPYANGKVHLGTAWNKTLKDAFLRYKRFKGMNVFDRAGYDTHGLPTSNKVMKELNLKTREDIEAYGVAKFVTACRDFVETNIKHMRFTFEDELAVWMDFDNPYKTCEPSYVESTWFLLKKAYEQGRIYEGYRAMPWCPINETGLAKHDLEYQTVTDTSVFLKFALKETPNTYLVIWTTTPWTIPLNLGVMVNPNEEYVFAKTEKGETLILAQKLVGVLMQSVFEQKYTVEKTVKGEELEGLAYTHPFFDEIEGFKTLDAEKVHTVLLSKEYVDTTAGTGLVHCAPGCGPEDYEVGYKYGLPAFNPISTKGVFPKSCGKFAQLIARNDDKKFIEAFKEADILLATSQVEHEYPHSDRTHKPIIFRPTKQWFLKVEDIKDKMLKFNDETFWQPKSAYNGFKSWLTHLRDNSITRQIHWGTPAPIWKCSACDHFEILSSRAEIKEKSGKDIEDVHVPWIDEGTTYACSKCKEGTMQRIPDTLDVWVDAGVGSWAALDYPQTNELFDRWYAADFISEGKDQIRGWFNLLMVAGVVAFDRQPFKAAYMHGFINDAQGRKMSKSLGNYILPEEVIADYGTDTFRYYVLTCAVPGADMNYNFDDVKLKHKNLNIIWNIHNLLLDLHNNLGMQVHKLDTIRGKLKSEDRYILSRLHETISTVEGAMDNYLVNEAMLQVEQCFLELSRDYIQMVRSRLNEETDETAFSVVYHVYSSLVTLFSIAAPFICEQIYADLKVMQDKMEESVFLAQWPEVDQELIDLDLSREVSAALQIVQAILHGREKAKRNVRWPLKQVIVRNHALKDDRIVQLIKELTNVKSIEFDPSASFGEVSMKPVARTIKDLHGDLLPKILAELKTQDAKSLRDTLTLEGKVLLKIDDKDAALTDNCFVFSEKTPEHIILADNVKHYLCYLDTTLTEEIEMEGYLREVIRRIQSLRRDAGLQKSDTIILFVDAQGIVQKSLETYKETLLEKVGAKDMHFAAREGSEHVSIKNEQLALKVEKA